jgi:hypothetical protein
MFARLLALPFGIMVVLFLYLASMVDEKYAPWMVPFLLIGALLLIFSPQINWWWYTRHPQGVSAGLTRLLEQSSGFYRRLGQADRTLFRNRLGLFIMANDWTPMGFPEDTMPPDVQMMLGAQAIMLTLRKPVFLFPKFEKVIIYPFPFPSPEYQFAHASELFERDGCLLFSAKQVVAGFMTEGRMYNIGLHEYARVFVLTYPDEPYPDFESAGQWEKLAAATGMGREHVESVIGLAGVSALPVAIHHFFTFPDQFKAAFPEESGIFEKIFS